MIFLLLLFNLIFNCYVILFYSFVNFCQGWVEGGDVWHKTSSGPLRDNEDLVLYVFALAEGIKAARLTGTRMNKSFKNTN